MYEVLALVALIALVFELVFISYLMVHMISTVDRIGSKECSCHINDTFGE